MGESLFQITCPSCESVFAVTDPELIGQIIACPKCGGMTPVVEAEVAENAGLAQSGENGGGAEVKGVAQDFEPSTFEAIAQDKRSSESATNGEKSENGEVGETGGNSVPLERSRGGGKLAASGIALALVGALAFVGLRGFNNESSPTAETNVETNVGGENGNIGENGKNGGNGGSASNEIKDEVGGFAPLAIEERTSENESETEFWGNDSTALEDGEDAEIGVFGENDEETSSGGLGENASVLGDATDDGDAETSGEAEERNVDPSENSENREDGEVDAEGEDASNVTTSAVENAPESDEFGALGDLGEEAEEAPNVEDGEELGALGTEDEETAEGEKLAGSNDATGFNEADFERANQNVDSENADEPVEVDWSGVASTTNPTLQGALPTLRRERKEIDVDARFALPIKSIEFPSSPVAAVRLLSEFTGVSIVPELETFVLTRPSTGATLDLALRDATAGEALEKVAELLNWEVCKEKDRVLIRPLDCDSERLIEERIAVADLTAGGVGADATRLDMFELPNRLTSESLAALIKSTVAPETWNENGGKANFSVDGANLAISQNGQNREKIKILLEGLRAIRGLEPQSDAAPERIIPEKLGWERLTKKTTFAPLTPLALQNAVEILEKSQKIQVFWDDATLIEAGVGRDATTAARIENGTLDVILSEILEPLDATYLILGENLIFLTGKDAAENYRTVEFFSLVGENGARPTLDEARALVEEIKRTIAPETWRTSGASNGENSEIAENGEVGAREEIAGIIGDAANSGNAGDARNIGNEEETSLDAENEVGEIDENRGDVAIEERGKSGESGENALSGKTPLSERNAVVWLDVESSCLIVRQSQPNQRALRRWLTARLADWATEGNAD